MAKNDDYEQEVTLPELKEILFKIANDEMEGYLHAIEQMKEAEAEAQKQRYVAVFQIIDKAGLNSEFASYRSRVERKK